MIELPEDLTQQLQENLWKNSQKHFQPNFWNIPEKFGISYHIPVRIHKMTSGIQKK